MWFGNMLGTLDVIGSRIWKVTWGSTTLHRSCYFFGVDRCGASATIVVSYGHVLRASPNTRDSRARPVRRLRDC